MDVPLTHELLTFLQCRLDIETYILQFLEH